MSGFTIDDVRESFERDVTEMLTQSRSKLGVLGSSRVADVQTFEPEIEHVERLAGLFHSVHGTTALVSAKSLATTAKSLESTAEEVKSSIRIVAHETAKIRELLGHCGVGVDRLFEMLELELAGKRPQADEIAARFGGRAAPEDHARAPSEEEPGVEPELMAVFEEEAEDLLSVLKRGLEEIGTTAEPSERVREMRRALHTLKGAAAMIGLEAASAGARAAHERLDEMLESGAIDAAEAMAVVQRAGRRVLSSVRSPRLHTRFLGVFEAPSQSEAEPSVRPRPVVDQDISQELEDVFTQEVQEVREALQAAFTRWHKAPAQMTEAVKIARVLHQLKGAAATVGKTAIVGFAAELRGRIDGVVDTAATIDKGFVSKLEADVSTLVAQCGARPLDPPSQPDAHGSASGVFRAEARDILAQALALSESLLGASLSEAGDINKKLGRLFHRLKGSALLGADPRIAQIAKRLSAQADAGDITPIGVRSAVEELAALFEVQISLPADRTAGSRPPPSDSEEHAQADVSIEPELWEAFEQEFRELTDSIDERVLSLEQSDEPKKDIAFLLRSLHTLKGAVNTVGMSPTGQMIHAVEDLLEGLGKADAAVPLREVSKLLVFVQSEVRRQLKQAKSGKVSAPVGELQRRLRRIGKSEPESARVVTRDRGSEQSRGSGHESEALSGRGEIAMIRVPAARLDALMNLAGELVVYRGKLVERARQLEGLHRNLDDNRKKLVDVVDVFRANNEFSLIEQRAQGARAAAAAAGGPSAFSELELDRYDDVNLLSRRVAELTDDVNEVSTSLVGHLHDLGEDAEALSTVIGGIQSEVTRARMVPLESLFSRLRMPVRDAADREGREVRVQTVGADVSLDKTVADALFQPLLHVVRNAVVHGIESPERRGELGKPREGTVSLRAREDAGQVVLEIEDDGAGLDLEKLRALGVERKLLPPDIALDDPAVCEMVFESGLSTRDKATDAAGRGVGGEVVKRAVQRLNGRIDIRTKARAGTTFIIYLPISLAISKALIVRFGEKTFALPLHFAVRLLSSEEARFVQSAGTTRLLLPEGLVGMFDLRGALRIPGEPKATGPIVVVRFGDELLAFRADKVVAQEEIVIKDLGALFQSHPFFSGITVRGTGELVLLVDVSSMFEHHFKDRGRPRGARPAAEHEAEAREARPAKAEKQEPRPEPTKPRAAQKAAALVVPPVDVAVRSTPKVLFVDDSLSVRKVAERMLETIGVEFALAVDGVEALEKLRVGGFDLVFTDLEMPRMNGFDLLRELRFLPSFRELPVVVVSSRSGAKHQAQARELGANQYLTKPFTDAQLRASIQELVARRGPSSTGKR